MFKRKSLQKYAATCNKLIEYYTKYYENNPEKAYFDIVFSKGNKKIGNTLNVSQLPGFTCGFNCKHCLPYCYDIKACLQYKNVLHARVKNYVIYKLFPNTYWNRVDHELKKNYKHKYFRIHVGGDIPDEKYLEKMIEIACKHTDWNIWTYTKQYTLVNAYILEKGAIPYNLHIMFSNWQGLQCDNMWDMPEFRCIMPGDKPKEREFKCPGNCNVCMENKTGCLGWQNTYVNLH